MNIKENRMADIHSHIIYGVDDGAASPGESSEMLLAARSAGFETIYATPHLRGKDTDINGIREKFTIVKNTADEMGLNLKLGFEVNVSFFSWTPLENAGQYTLGDSGFILLELNRRFTRAYLKNIVYSLHMMGLTPMIAHPERFCNTNDDLEFIGELVGMGARPQIDADAFTLSVFNPMRRNALKIIRDYSGTLIASDAHCARDYEKIAAAGKKLVRFGSDRLKAFFSGI